MKLNIIIIGLVVTAINLYAQNEFVAKGKNFEISKEEYKKRFEFSPHPRQDSYYDSVTIKFDFLKTLIAEKLLANNAIEKELDKTDEFLSAYKYVRNLYLRDALYQKEVKEKINVPDSEYVKGKKKILKSIIAKFIFSNDEKEITEIYSALNKGASFDSILAIRPERNEQKENEEITFGKLNEKIEDDVFNLQVGQYTKPLELKEGWYIFKVYSFTRKSILDENDLRKIDKVVKERWENKVYESFYKKFFKNVTINADRKLFDRLFEEIKKYVFQHKNSFIKKFNKYKLYEPEFAQIGKNITPSEMQSIFVKFKEDPITLKEFLTNLKINGFEFLNFDEKHLRSRLNTDVFLFIQNELLAREALKRGYDKLQDVAFDLKLWKENFLSSLNMKTIFKNVSVDDDEAYNFFIKNNKIITKPDIIKIAEIKTKDLDDVKNVFEELDKGEDFKKLVNKYSAYNSAKQNNGEYELSSDDKENEIFKIASSLKVGEVYGPIKTIDGYSIIKLIDKKNGKKVEYESFEQAKNDIKDILKTKKMYKELENITAQLAIDNDIEINENVLNAIKVNMINMIVFKRFGFGGQNLATPYHENFSNWYKTYEYLKKKLSL